MAERVSWELPQSSDSITLWPLGTGTGRRWPFTGRTDRMLVISPFLSDRGLSCLTAHGHGNIVVSRAESLDGLGRKAYERVDVACVLSDAAHPELSEEIDEPSDPPEKVAADCREGCQGKLAPAPFYAGE